MIRPVCVLLAALLCLYAPTVSAQTTRLLPETYVSDDESLTLRYPAGWLIEAEDTGFIIVATSEMMFDIGNETVPSGEAAIALLFSTADDAYLGEFFAGDDAVTVLENIIDILFSTADMNIEFTAPAAVTVGGLDAARADALFAGNHVFLLVTDREDEVFNLVIGITSEAEFSKFEPKLLAIAESVRYLPPSD